MHARTVSIRRSILFVCEDGVGASAAAALLCLCLCFHPPDLDSATIRLRSIPWLSSSDDTTCPAQLAAAMARFMGRYMPSGSPPLWVVAATATRLENVRAGREQGPVLLAGRQRVQSS
jgi:hypothetical protein